MSSLLAAELALLAWGLEFAVAWRRDLGLSARQHLVRRDESDGAVQRDLVVSHILAIQAPRILGRQHAGADALACIAGQFLPIIRLPEECAT